MSGTRAVMPFAAADSGAAVAAWLLGIGIGALSRRLALSRMVAPMLRSHGRELARFFGHNWLAGAVRGVTTYGAETILSVVSTFTAVGTFGMARRLASVLSFLLSPFLYLVTPWVYRAAAAGDVSVMRRLLARITLGSLIPIVIVDAMLLGAGDYLLSLVAGMPVPGGIAPLLMLAAAFSLQFAFSWSRPAALGMQMSGLVVVSQVLSGTVLVLATLTLAASWGAVGAASAVLAAYVMDVGTVSVSVMRRLSRGTLAAGGPAILEPSTVSR
jgi:O-antigen/teichoic acid export membrane protein